MSGEDVGIALPAALHTIEEIVRMRRIGRLPLTDLGSIPLPALQALTKWSGSR